jgi:hypothetical protein
LLSLDSFAHFTEEVATGQSPASGIGIADTYNTKSLNTTRVNNISGVSVNANQVTLPAGTYYIEAQGEGNSTDANRLKIRNVTDNTDLLIGKISYSSAVASSSGGHTTVNGSFTLTSTKTIELQHYIGTSPGSTSFGSPINEVGENEVYGELRIWKTVEAGGSGGSGGSSTTIPYAEVGLLSSQAVTGTNPIIWDSEIVDTNNNYNPSTGEYTVPHDCILEIEGLVDPSTDSSISIDLYVGGIFHRTISSNNTNQRAWIISAMVRVEAGQVITIVPQGTITVLTNSYIIFRAIPHTIAGGSGTSTTLDVAEYIGQASATVDNTLVNAARFDTKVKDDNDDYNPTSGVYTVPSDGVLDIFVAMGLNAGGNTAEGLIRVNDIQQSNFTTQTVDNRGFLCGTAKLVVNAGDTVSIHTNISTTTVAAAAGSGARVLFHLVPHTIAGGTGGTTQTGLLSIDSLLHVTEQEASGTDAGAISVNAWTTRTLNTERTNTISGATLVSDQITLPAGEYYLDGSAYFALAGFYRTKIRNITDGTDLLLGTSEYGQGENVGTRSFVSGKISLASTKTIELQYWATINTGAGASGDATTTGEEEVYADLKIWKTVEAGGLQEP